MGNEYLGAFGMESESPAVFRAAVKYFAAMDCAIFLKEDCSYRSCRISKKLSLLLDPYQDEVVGVKIKGVQHLAEQLVSILGDGISDELRVELRQLLRIALVTEEEAARALTEAEAERRKQLAERAMQFLKQENDLFFELPLKMAA